MKKAMLMPVAVLITAFFTQTVCAEMYKWTDKDGKTQYTQTPPPANVDSKNIEDDIRLSTGKLGNDIPTAPAAKGNKDEMEKAREEGEKSEQKHRDFCAQQADALKQMTANALVKWKDTEGERILTAEEKQSKMKDVQKNIDTLCRPEMFTNKGDSNTSQTEKAVGERFSTDNSAQKSGAAGASGKDKGAGTAGGNVDPAAAQLPAAD